MVDGTEGTHLRGGRDNLFYRAARCAWEAAGHPPIPLEARISLSAPPARGLGSSASAIVAGLCGANTMIGSPLSREKLLELAIALEGHPDNVTPSLLGGLCLTSRIAGRRWRVVTCPWHEGVRAVVAIPNLRLSTAEARRVLPRNVPLQDAVNNLSALTVLLAGLRSGDGALIADGLRDGLHEPYRWPLIPHGLHVRQAAMAAGAWGGSHQRRRTHPAGPRQPGGGDERGQGHGAGLGGAGGGSPLSRHRPPELRRSVPSRGMNLSISTHKLGQS